MTIDDSNEENDAYAAFSSTSFEGLQRRLNSGHVPDRAELAAVLAANPGRPLPGFLVECLCLFVQGELRRKPGPRHNSYVREIDEIAATCRYRRLMPWLKKRKRSQGLGGWSCIRDKDWWQGSPHERAVLMVRARSHLLRHISPRRLANIISSRK